MILLFLLTGVQQLYCRAAKHTLQWSNCNIHSPQLARKVGMVFHHCVGIFNHTWREYTEGGRRGAWIRTFRQASNPSGEPLQVVYQKIFFASSNFHILCMCLKYAKISCYTDQKITLLVHYSTSWHKDLTHLHRLILVWANEALG